MQSVKNEQFDPRADETTRGDNSGSGGIIVGYVITDNCIKNELCAQAC